MNLASGRQAVGSWVNPPRRPVKAVSNESGTIRASGSRMEEYTSSLRAQRIAGIPADHWILFFKRHAEAKDPMAILDVRACGRDARAPRTMRKRKIPWQFSIT